MSLLCGTALAGCSLIEMKPGKLANKNGNLFVYNDVSQPGVGFESEDNEIVLLSARGERNIGRRSKEECAVAILEEVEALLDLSDIDPKDVQVQLFAGPINATGQIERPEARAMTYVKQLAPGRHVFSGTIEFNHTSVPKFTKLCQMSVFNFSR